MSYPLDEAQSILKDGWDAIQERSITRDDDGDKSMSRAVEMFNAYMGGDRYMSESDGWEFMSLLKKARSKQGNIHRDDYVDGAAYTALAGEARIREEAEGNPGTVRQMQNDEAGWNRG